MSERVYRYEVPVDDEWHDLPLTGPVLRVACRRRDVVEVWAVHRDAELPPSAVRTPTSVTVIGTGHTVPVRRDFWDHLGTVITPDGDLVWHLIRLVTP